MKNLGVSPTTFRIAKKHLIASFLVMIAFFSGECINSPVPLLTISKVTINGISLNLNDPNEIQTNIPLDPTVVLTFSKTVTLSDVQTKVKIITQAGNQDIPINIVKTSSNIFTVTLRNGVLLAKNTEYLIMIEKGLSATVESETYIFNKTVSISFKTHNKNSDTSLSIEYNSNLVTPSGTAFLITVPLGTNLSSVSLKLTIGKGAQLYHGNSQTALTLNANNSATQSYDFSTSNTMSFRVLAEDETEQVYQVTVTSQLSNSKDITAFVFRSSNNSNLASNITGQINGTTINIILPANVSRQGLVPNIEISGEGVSPASGLSQDFTNTITYTVKAADGSMQAYTVQVTNADPNNYIVTFNTGVATINVPQQQVESGKKAVAPSDPTRSGYTFGGWYKEASFQTKFVFENEVVVKDITLYAKWIDIPIQSSDTSLSIEYNNNLVTPSGTTFLITVPFGTSLNSISLELTIGERAQLYHGNSQTALTLNVNNSVTQSYDFSTSNTISFKVVAEDGTEQVYQVTVTLQLSNSKDITAFVFRSSNNSNLSNDIAGQINGTTINIILPANVSRQGLIPSIEISGASVSPASGLVQDFTNTITYTVKAADGSMQAYTVQVINADPNNYIVTFNTSVATISVPQQQVESGKKAVKPNDPTRSEYMFGGWYKEASFQTKFVFENEVIIKDITLYAKWLSKSTLITMLNIGSVVVMFTNNSAAVNLPYGIEMNATSVSYTNLFLAPGATAKDANAGAGSQMLGSAGTLLILNNTLRIRVTAEDETTSQDYAITIIETADKPTAVFYTGVDTLGQAIKDEDLMDFPVATVSNLANINYTITLGNTSFTKTASSGSFTVMKSDLLATNASDNAALTIKQGSGAALTLAYYKPANIYTWQDLQAMRKDLSGNYVLLKDIVFPDLGQDRFPTSGFEPVGKDLLNSTDLYGQNVNHQGSTFEGSLNGNNKTITNFAVDNEAISFVGLFGKVEAATNSTEVLKNLVFVNPNIVCKAIAGTAVGWLQQGKIVDVGIELRDNSANKIETTGLEKLNPYREGYAYVGALAGYVGIQGEIKDCYSQVPVKGSGGIVGALVGNSDGKVQGYAVSDISGGDYVGGLVGVCGQSSRISGYATGDISGNTNVGGLVGRNIDGEVEGHATGDVNGNRFIGGLIGQNNGNVTGYATGEVTGGNDVGGLAGWNDANDQVIGYATGNVSGGNYIGGLVGSNVGNAKGYATGTVTSTGFDVGGLIGNNSGGSAEGYATGSVNGNTKVGGLVGINHFGSVKGYATGNVNGNDNVGGLVGKNESTYIGGVGNVVGFATGDVRGVKNTGGLVGFNASPNIRIGGTTLPIPVRAEGYSRGTVTRKSGSLVSFGALTGEDSSSATVTGYSSRTLNEGGVLDDQGRTLLGRTGRDGTGIDQITILSATQATFNMFAFGGSNPWLWVSDRRWPAINLDFSDSVLSNANDEPSKQPTTP